jgi:polyhydroxyalkanoate synthesis regulator phasin
MADRNEDFEKSEAGIISKVLARTISDYTTAQSAVLIALLSLLVKKGVLTADDVKEEILDSLAKAAESARQHVTADSAEGSRDLRQIHAIENIVSHLRGRLFPDENS